MIPLPFFPSSSTPTYFLPSFHPFLCPSLPSSSTLPNFLPLSLSPFIHPIPPSPPFNFSFFLFPLSSLSLRPSLSSSLPSRYPASFAFYTLVKDLCFLAIIFTPMSYQYKIFRQILKLICSSLLNKTLQQAFSYNSVLKN